MDVARLQELVEARLYVLRPEGRNLAFLELTKLRQRCGRSALDNYRSEGYCPQRCCDPPGGGQIFQVLDQ